MTRFENGRKGKNRNGVAGGKEITGAQNQGTTIVMSKDRFGDARQRFPMVLLVWQLTAPYCRQDLVG